MAYAMVDTKLSQSENCVSTSHSTSSLSTAAIVIELRLLLEGLVALLFWQGLLQWRCFVYHPSQGALETVFAVAVDNFFFCHAAKMISAHYIGTERWATNLFCG